MAWYNNTAAVPSAPVAPAATPVYSWTIAGPEGAISTTDQNVASYYASMGYETTKAPVSWNIPTVSAQDLQSVSGFNQLPQAVQQAAIANPQVAYESMLGVNSTNSGATSSVLGTGLAQYTPQMESGYTTVNSHGWNPAAETNAPVLTSNGQTGSGDLSQAKWDGNYGIIVPTSTESWYKGDGGNFMTNYGPLIIAAIATAGSGGLLGESAVADSAAANSGVAGNTYNDILQQIAEHTPNYADIPAVVSTPATEVATSYPVADTGNGIITSDISPIANKVTDYSKAFGPTPIDATSLGNTPIPGQIVSSDPVISGYGASTPATINQVVGQETGLLDSFGNAAVDLVPGVNSVYDFNAGVNVPAVVNESGSLIPTTSLASQSSNGLLQSLWENKGAIKAAMGLLGGSSPSVKNYSSSVGGGYDVGGNGLQNTGLLSLKAAPYKQIFA